jgi:hypothetical protein
MRTSLLSLCFFSLAFFSACTSIDTTKLRIGMTKDEVFTVMGKPDSVGADGNFEYLNYRLSSSAGYGTLTQPYTVRLANGHVIAYGVGSNLPFASRITAISSSPSTVVRTITESAEATENGIRILSLEPAAVVADQPTEFKIKVAYALKESSGGTIQLAFNTLGPKSFATAATKSISTGSGEIELVATATPKDWGALTGFTANAILRDSTNRLVTASTREIPLTK